MWPRCPGIRVACHGPRAGGWGNRLGALESRGIRTSQRASLHPRVGSISMGKSFAEQRIEVHAQGIDRNRIDDLTSESLNEDTAGGLRVESAALHIEIGIVVDLP